MTKVDPNGSANERLKNLLLLQQLQQIDSSRPERSDSDRDSEPGKRQLVPIGQLFRRLLPLLPDARRQTDEPIQEEPYLRILASLAGILKPLITEAAGLSAFLSERVHTMLCQILSSSLPAQDGAILMAFVAENEGEYNVFNFMNLTHLVTILKSPSVQKEVKLLAVRRWLSSDSPDKIDPADGEQQHSYANLVSFTTYFSDKFQKTSTQVARVTRDASRLLLELIGSQQLYEDFRPEDLPAEIVQACTDERIIFVFLQTPPKSHAQEETYLTWLGTALKQVAQVDTLLNLCPRLFSWSSRVLHKACPAGF